MSSSVVCINLSGTYTVDLDSSTSVGSLQLGGGATGVQTLELDGSSGDVALTLAADATSTVAADGGLVLDPTASGYAELTGSTATLSNSGTVSTSGPSDAQPAYLETALINQSGGTVTVGAATDQDDGTLTTNAGTFTVASGGDLTLSGNSSFSQTAGTLALSGSMTEGSGTFTESGGTESGNPVVLNGAALADSGGTGGFDATGDNTISGTIASGQTVTADGRSGDAQLAFASDVTDDGTLAVVGTPDGYADITDTGGVTVASGGLLSVSAATGSQPAYLETPITNQSGGTITVSAPATYQDEGTLTTNAGTFTVASGGNLTLSGSSSFTQTAGTLALRGSMSEGSGTFTESGGTGSGNPVGLDGVTLADSAGTTGFDVMASSTLTGTIPSGQTVTVDGGSGNVQLAFPDPVTDLGTVALVPTSGGYADITDTGGVTVASGGVLSVSAAAGSQPAYLESPVINQSGGTVTVGAATDQDDGTLTTNAGTFTVASGGDLTLSGNSSFSQTAGTLALSGSMTEGSGTFTESGGTESGNPVVLNGAALADSGGTGGFDATGDNTISGTIASGQTVTADGRSGDAQLAFASDVTDDGTLAVVGTPDGYADITDTGGVTVASGGLLSVSAATGSQPAYLETPITNQSGGTITVSAPATDQDEGTVTANKGALEVTDGGQLNLIGSSTLTNSAGATLGVTVDATTGAVSGISGQGVRLAGTLRVTTVGTPAVGSTWTPIGGPVTGTFSSVASGPTPYAVSYPSASVELTATRAAPAVTAISPSSGPTAGHTTVTITGTGFTGATKVLFGTVAATAYTVVSNTTITATSPAHAAKSLNIFVTNSGGTSPAVTADRFTYLAAPAVTAVSPNSGPTAGDTTVTITGIGFGDATKVLFGTAAATGFTVVSGTKITATSPAHPAKTLNISVTTPGGTSATVTADRFTYN